MLTVPVQGEVDMRVPKLDEDRMPVLVVQQAAQGEGCMGIRGGQVSTAYKDSEANEPPHPTQYHGCCVGGQLSTMAAMCEVNMSPSHFPCTLLSGELVNCLFLSLMYNLLSLRNDFFYLSCVYYC